MLFLINSVQISAFAPTFNVPQGKKILILLQVGYTEVEHLFWRYNYQVLVVFLIIIMEPSHTKMFRKMFVGPTEISL